MADVLSEPPEIIGGSERRFRAVSYMLLRLDYIHPHIVSVQTVMLPSLLSRDCSAVALSLRHNERFDCALRDDRRIDYFLFPVLLSFPFNMRGSTVRGGRKKDVPPIRSRDRSVACSSLDANCNSDVDKVMK